MPLLLLPGASAQTATKRAALIRTIRAHHTGIVSVDSVFLHYVWTERELSGAETNVLETLLKYGDDVRLKETPSNVNARLSGAVAFDGAVAVAPRHGTISPWSSKATDIAKMCNLGGIVKRIERGVLFLFRCADGSSLSVDTPFVAPFAQHLHDRMTQRLLFELPAETDIFSVGKPGLLRTVDIVGSEDSALTKLATANKTLGLALADEEMRYLAKAFCQDRNPTDVELFMFAQVNSEHCRHKIFNAEWTIDGQKQDHSLFGMIRNTHKITPQHTVSAYSDNAAVLEGYSTKRFAPFDGSVYSSHDEDAHILIKVETHNHPTAVSPYPGAATGSGGEIRDEGAVGRGSKPKAGLAGYTVSNLLIPGYEQPWETDFGKPHHIASALDIMIEAPLGSCAFNNEFGRPALAGYFRTFAEEVPTATGSEVRGYHKPVMIAGGLGNVRPQYALKDKITPGAKIVVLGGPGMLIGLGGGAASSMVSGASSADLDFASVQRENPEMQRRCQQVIDACCFSTSNPIQSIHDVGAGGLSNALPELVHDAGLGAVFEIRDVLIDDPAMSPMEIWCNESQERYVLAIDPAQLRAFQDIAKRERCPYSVVGIATEEQRLVVTDRVLGNNPIDLAMSTLFGKAPKISRQAERLPSALKTFDSSLAQYIPQIANDETAVLSEAISRVLRLPSVGSKSFLITIGDRTVTGLVARDQMVGPWQVPVADVAVTQTSYGFDVRTGEAMAMGERTPLALISAGASAKMAVAEALTNLAAASFESLDRVKLSANWMSAASHGDEGALLYDAVQAVGLDLCPALGVSIPVGKDSMSMSMKWQDRDESKQVIAPLSLIVTAFAPVDNVRDIWTPQLRTDLNTPTVLIFVDLADGKQRLGGSALAQVFKQIGNEAPDVQSADVLRGFLQGCQSIRRGQPDLVLAYHDRSDGGLFTTFVEMAFAGRTGLDISLDAIASKGNALTALFNEELGAVFQIRQTDVDAFTSNFVRAGVPSIAIHVVASLAPRTGVISVFSGGKRLYSARRADLQQIWAETSYRMQSLRDNPALAKDEYENIQCEDRGLAYHLTFKPNATIPTTASLHDRPRVAVLREQGVNGHVEMAWSFTAAGFMAVDVHMSDILSGRVDLASFQGLAACGGFSYGDVLGAGSGWAKSILLNETARSQFRTFFSDRKDTFALAVCNGCQLFGQLKHLLPGCSSWPAFQPNLSERFEGRVCILEIDSPQAEQSVFFAGMHGSQIPVAVAHGEGRAHFTSQAEVDECLQKSLIPLRYIDTQTGKPTNRYPYNPNGGSNGVAGVQSPDGRFLAIMPHPERNTLAVCNSYVTSQQVQDWQGCGPWFRIFQNARAWVG